MPLVDVGFYKVVCREDSKPDGTPGKYVLATQRDFPTEQKAIKYARSVSPSRMPMVVLVVWANPRPGKVE